MIELPETLTPGRKALHTARIMTKWLVTYSGRTGAKWRLIDFGGKTGSEARGIVDLMAIRKDHRRDHPGVKRGDLFEIVLIQTKGGSAPRPTADDLARLSRVGRRYKAKAIVLVEWRRAKALELFRLSRNQWKAVSPSEIFA